MDVWRVSEVTLGNLYLFITKHSLSETINSDKQRSMITLSLSAQGRINHLGGGDGLGR